MSITGDVHVLKIFLGSLDKTDGQSLYEALVFEAKRHGMAGATVLKGTMGFGASSLIHSGKILEIYEELPIVVEIVDEKQKIEQFIPIIEPLLEKAKHVGFITVENIEVKYSKGR